MMLSKTLETALSRQVNRELYSAYLYLVMSSYFESVKLKGFARWMRVQAKEEQVHAMKIFDYIVAREGTVAFQDIETPPGKWTSPANVFEYTYAHEQKVTGMIQDLVTLATSEKDAGSLEMLQWFVKEQVEEEENASGILGQIKAIGNDPGNLFYLDQKLGKRQ